MRIGIDTGGTFTDLVVLAEGGGRVHKMPSTPDDPLRAILAGLRELCPGGLAGAEVVHGTTVGTNAFLTRRGAKVVLLTTAGFEDVLFIGRQTRRELFSLAPQKPPELLPRERVVGVKERLRADGAVLKPLAAEEVERLRRRILELAPESLAVCLLHAYANGEHEASLGRGLADLGLPLSLSHQVLPELREFERTSATVLNAYLAPVLSRYLAAWQKELPTAPLFIQQSNGGFLPARRASRLGLATILSGPAGGVFGAWKLAREAGEERILTLDMGGTSTDVALVAGALPYTSDYELEGYPLGLRVLDIHTVGAGGGSIAYRDRGGALRVGPASAGADPGPVCYGQGQEVTVTDAQLFLGRLVPECFLGGRLALHQEATARAMSGLAGRFGVSPREVALAITRVASSHLAKALAKVSLERGYDPRDFTLVSFGGAAGLHVCEVAEELGVSRLLLPAQAGVLSALGMAMAGLRRDVSRTLLLHGEALTWARLREEAAALRAQGQLDLAADGLQGREFSTHGELEMRYRGQTDTLTVPLSPAFREEFHHRHRRFYGHAWPERQVEAVILRLHFLAREYSGSWPRLAAAGAGAPPPLPPRLRVVLPSGAEAEIPWHWRAALPAGFTFTGPALVLEDFATHLVLPGFQGRLTPEGHLLVWRANSF